MQTSTPTSTCAEEFALRAGSGGRCLLSPIWRVSASELPKPSAGGGAAGLNVSTDRACARGVCLALRTRRAAAATVQPESKGPGEYDPLLLLPLSDSVSSTVASTGTGTDPMPSESRGPRLDRAAPPGDAIGVCPRAVDAGAEGRPPPGATRGGMDTPGTKGGATLMEETLGPSTGNTTAGEVKEVTSAEGGGGVQLLIALDVTLA